MMTELDIFNQLHYAKEDGFAEGKAEGEKYAKIETARNFKSKGIELSIISECTGLSIKEIAEL